MPTRVTKSGKARKKTTVVKKDDKPDGYVFGRPTVYKPEFCQLAIDIMKKGGAKCEVAAAMYVSEDTFYKWVKKYPDFSEAVSIGQSLSEAYWTKLGRDNVITKFKGDSLNAGVYGLHMKNRFNWSDKNKTTHELEEETAKTLAFGFQDKPKNREE